jgi:glucose-1-phosphate cytidylyltransferase
MMKAVILCGGRGRRLSESTEFLPKPLVEIGGKPILWHIMKLYAHQGIKEFILCLGYKGEKIKEFFLKLEASKNDFLLDLQKEKVHLLTNREDLDVKIIFADTGQETMTGARIAKIKKYIGEDEDFFVTYGDGVADINLEELYNFHKKMGKIGTLTVVHPVYWYGLTVLKDGLITSFDEKPEMKDFINGGFMVFNGKIFDYLSEDEACVLEQEPLKKLANDNQLAGYHHQGFWKAMDTQKDVDSLEKIYAEGAPWEIWKKWKKNYLFPKPENEGMLGISLSKEGDIQDKIFRT